MRISDWSSDVCSSDLVGALGYFAHPALSAAKPRGEALANYGLMDQLAALRWVKKNIAAFGGDPRQITLFGESAGAIGVPTILAQPEAQGLFAKATVQSGVGILDPRDRKSVVEGKMVAVLLDLGDS